jgi:hypothetical protein
MKKKNTYLLGFALLLATQPAMAQDVAAHFDLRYKLGNKRQITSPELFVPLQQDNNSVLFADIRAMFDADNNKEGNLGLGYRQLEQDYIWGVYSFFDRRKSENDLYHSQATLGAEWLTENWDFRVNAYAPLTDEKTLSGFGGGPTSLELQGNNVLQIGGGSAVEKSMRGFDAEVGYQFLPGLRAFAGGYAFRASGVPDIDGFRGRMQYDVNDYVRLGLEYQRDNVRGENRYAEIRVRIPFGAAAKDELKGLRKRLGEPVVRDIDIVTSVKKTEGGGFINNPDTGQAQEIWYVNNSNTDPSGGDGTYENPFTTLQDAIVSAGTGDIIYVYRGNATSTGMDGSFLLGRAGMQLIGSNANMVYDGTRVTFGSSGEVLVPSGGRFPFLVNSSGGTVLTIANQNIRIAGLDVSGATTDFAIKSSGGNVSGLQIDNVKISNSQGGISLTSPSITSATLRNVEVSGVTDTGILANNIGNLTMQNAQVRGDVSYVSNGILLNYDTAGTYNVSFDNVNADQHARGISFVAENSANVTANVENSASYFTTRAFNASADSGASLVVNASNSVFDTSDYGVYVESLDNSTTLTMNFTDVGMSNNTTAGFYGADQFTLNLDTANAPFNLSNSNDGIFVRNTTGLATINLGAGVQVTGNTRGYVNEYAAGLGAPSALNEADGSGNNVTGNTTDTDITSF